MIRQIAFFALLLLFALQCNSVAGDIPIFELPPNNYPLFLYSSPFSSSNSKVSNIHPLKKPSNTVNFKISGVFRSEGKAYVLINHRIYGVGDKVDGYTITAIEQSKVVFSKGGKRIVESLARTPSVRLTDHTLVSDNSTN